ncbi:MAG: DinB family protein [Dehalococcoidia bacterium]
MAQSGEERRQQVLSYVKHQAEKDIADIKVLVQEEWGRLQALIEGLTQAQADFRPGPDQWSAAEVVRHLTLSNQRVRDRIAALARGQAIDVPTRPGTLPSDEGLPFNEVAQQFQEVAEEIMAVVDGCDPWANLDLTSAHGVFGPLNWRQWLAFLRVHGRDHSQQVEGIKNAPAFPGSQS